MSTTDPRFTVALASAINHAQLGHIDAVRVLILDGVSGFSTGYQFQPLRNDALATTENPAPEPAYVEIGLPLFVAAVAPTKAAALTDITAYLAHPPAIMAAPADIAAYRYGVENGGVAVAVSSGTHRFDTTRENRSMWLALQLQAQVNPALTQGWKTLDHGFVLLTAADILAVCGAVYAHVSACFAKEAALLAAPPALAALPAAYLAA